MNRRYRLHPGDYAVGENEKWYGDMAARGWRLNKRGLYLSRFERAQPERARYRIELIAPDFLDEPGMPAEQLTLYEDCGWTLAAQRGIVHVFRAPADSSVPELHTDPRQQAASLKKIHRRDLWGYLWVAVIVALNLLPLLIAEGTLPGAWAALGRVWRRFFVEYTAPALGFAFFLTFWLFRALWDSVSLQRLYYRLKRGVPFDHAPRGRTARRLASAAIGLCAAVFLALGAVQLLSSYRGDLPVQPNGPYLLLSELGWQGERTENFFGSQSRLEYTQSFLARKWDVCEFVDAGDDSIPMYLYQEVYQLRSPEAARRYVPVLMADATFGDGPESFTPLDIPGLDGAWCSGGRLDYVILCGRYAAYITYGDHDADPAAFLSAYAARLAQEQ